MQEQLKNVIEATAPATGAAVSGMTLLGIPLEEWVFVGTGILLLCNLYLVLPKVWGSLYGQLKTLRDKFG